MKRPRLFRFVLGVALPVAMVSAGYAQRGFREGSGRFGGTPPRFRPPDVADARFSFC
jgi:hypothetical protein